MIACSIVARNYLAHARVLAASYARHHWGRRLSVLVIDGAAEALRAEPFETVLPEQLGLPEDEFRRMAAIYDVMELATALKPFFLRFLLDRGSEVAMFLDPDIEIFAPLDELGRLARKHGIVLIPHTLRPIPSDGRKPTSAELAVSGVYNLGFIAVAGSSRPCLEWWGERLRRDCLVSPEEGLFVDQRLMDFLPAFFTPYIFRDPAYNVAYWNLHEREVRWTGERYEVAGAPLRFFHFSGFDPMIPCVLSKHQGTTPRIVLGEHPVLARLCGEYAQHLFDTGYRECVRVPYGFATTANGVSFDRFMRRVYRKGLLEAERGRGAAPPAPLDPREAGAFIEWVGTPRALEALSPRSRVAALIQEGPHLGSQYALVRFAQRALLRMLRPLLIHEELVARALLQTVDEVSEKRNGRGSRSEV